MLRKVGRKLILVVDDDRDACNIITLSLEAIGDFRCMKASDGEEAVRMAVREHPDLIVMDV